MWLLSAISLYSVNVVAAATCGRPFPTPKSELDHNLQLNPTRRLSSNTHDQSSMETFVQAALDAVLPAPPVKQLFEYENGTETLKVYGT